MSTSNNDTTDDLWCPADEAKYPWLSMLRRAYRIADDGMASLVREEESRRGKKLACHKGCHVCCLRPSVPFSPLELAGISWFVCQKLTGPVRDTVRQQMENHDKTTTCPFLVERTCAIYPVRPLACRHFVMFGEVCRAGEDPWETRQDDCRLDEAAFSSLARRVSFEMLPYYGISGHRDKVAAFNDGFMVKITKPMHEIPWTEIAKNMARFG